MKTPHDIYLESVEEFKAKYCVDRPAQPIRWIRAIFLDDVDQIETVLEEYKSHTIRMLEADIERLEGEKWTKENCPITKMEYGIQGVEFIRGKVEGRNQALQSEIDYKKEQIKKIQGV